MNDLDIGVTYYGTFTKSGVSLTMKIYSDAARTAQVGGYDVSLVLHADHNLTYLMCPQTVEFAATSLSVTGYVENLGPPLTAGSKNLFAKFSIGGVFDSKQLFAKFTVRSLDTADLSAEFIVQQIGIADLFSEFVVQQTGTADLYAEFVVQQTDTADLFAEFTVRHSGIFDLYAEFIVRHSRFIRKRIYCKFEVRHSSSLNLKSIFKVSQATITEDLAAEFYVNQFNALFDLIAEFYIRPDMLDIKEFLVEEPVRKRKKNWLR